MKLVSACVTTDACVSRRRDGERGEMRFHFTRGGAHVQSCNLLCPREHHLDIGRKPWSLSDTAKNKLLAS